MTGEQFVNFLVLDINNISQKRTNFFNRFESEFLTIEQLQKFTKQYYWWSNNFTDSLIALALNLPNSMLSAKLEIIKTIYSEYGYGKVELIHPNLLKRFAYSIDLSDNELATVEPLEVIKNFMNKLKIDCLKLDFRESLGISLVMEVTALQEFEKLYNGLKKYKKFSNSELSFFSLHYKEEQNHSEWLSKAAASVALDDESQYLVRKGVLECIKGWENFWEKLYEFVFEDQA